MYVVENHLRLPMTAFNNCYVHEVIDQNECAFYVCTYIYYPSNLPNCVQPHFLHHSLNLAAIKTYIIYNIYNICYI